MVGRHIDGPYSAHDELVLVKGEAPKSALEKSSNNDNARNAGEQKSTAFGRIILDSLDNSIGEPFFRPTTSTGVLWSPKLRYLQHERNASPAGLSPLPFGNSVWPFRT